MKTNQLPARYTNVKQKDGLFTAIDRLDGDKEVVIEKSISNLYQRQAVGSKIHWKAVTYRNHILLGLVESFIRGEKLFTPNEAKLLSEVYVRYGWLDKNLAQLHWVPLSTIVKLFVGKELSGPDKSKFTALCKVLSLSVRDARTVHNVGNTKYNPIDALVVVSQSELVAEEVV